MSDNEKVRALPAKWREEADAYIARACEREEGCDYRWPGWMRDELHTKAGAARSRADELEAALAEQPEEGAFTARLITVDGVTFGVPPQFAERITRALEQPAGGGVEAVAWGVADKDGVLWVVDFGLATIIEKDAEYQACWHNEHGTKGAPFTVVAFYTTPPPAPPVDDAAVEDELPEGMEPPPSYRVTQFLPGIWQWETPDEHGVMVNDGTSYASPHRACFEAWKDYSDTLERALAEDATGQETPNG